MKKQSSTDWARLRNMTDEEIDRNALSDPDAQPTDEVFWADAEIIIPPKKVSISIRLDADLLEWLKSRHSPYQTLINGILRNYMEYQKDKEQKAA